jgi:hypothetical protein
MEFAEDNVQLADRVKNQNVVPESYISINIFMVRKTDA